MLGYLKGQRGEVPAHVLIPRPIGKTGGNLFLDRLERLLRERFHVANVVRTAKPTFAKPAPPGIIEQLRTVDAVVEALAD